MHIKCILLLQNVDQLNAENVHECCPANDITTHYNAFNLDTQLEFKNIRVHSFAFECVMNALVNERHAFSK